MAISEWKNPIKTLKNATWNYTISDLKAAMGEQFSVRSNRYLLEIPVDGTMSKKLAILARGARMPQVSNHTVDLWHKGRKFTVRGERESGGEIEFTFIDDSDCKLRQIFDEMIYDVDNPVPGPQNVLAGIFGETYQELVDIANSVIGAINRVRSAFQIKTPSQLKDALLGNNSPHYQHYINIWQLDRVGQSIYGYQLTNCFIKGMSETTFSDEENDQLTELTVTFQYSDFEPIVGNKSTTNIVDYLTGVNITELKETEKLFD